MRFIQRGRAVKSALAATAIAAAMAATAGTAFAAGNPADDATKGAQAAEQHRAPSAKGKLAAPRAASGSSERTATFPMAAVERDGWLNWYFPDGRGGFEASWPTAANFSAFKHYIQVDQDKDGQKDGAWSVLKDGRLLYTTAKPNQTASTKTIGGGWQIYNKVLSPGNLAGARESDLLAVDKAGVLWLYLGYNDGRVTARTKVGGGWGQYTEIAGQGDLNGDGLTDIVARDRAGVLWLYTGNGDRNDPFNNRTKIGGGWNTYNRILSVGDLDGDGRSDLVARGNDGTLWRYSGNGDYRDPFDNRVKIGWGYNSLNLI
ncbi:VCBS repeat-containing protein [Streptomyces melanogenes]|uniref:VCBS repeat-containing protein n=1 Tax=Streptomyces melanogenes TaxID=67326 RepID=A0ABZ1XDQ4_9ACTN|nr:VCBS repeat-containing protein [Streptomyces melanogenes]